MTAIETNGGTALAVPTYVSDRAKAESAVQTVLDAYGRIDIRFNNAGLMLLGPFTEADVDEFKRMIAITQKSLLYLTKAALPH